MKNIIEEVKSYQPYDEVEEADKKGIISFLEKNEDFLSRENKIAHMTVSAWIVNKEKTKALMIYHNIYQSWSWVGGHADEDNNLHRVILKEIEEETGLKKIKFLKEDIFGLNIITVENHLKKGKQVNAHLHLDIEYLIEADEQEPIRIKEDENSKIAWLSLEDAEKESTEEKMRKIYRRANQKLKEWERENDYRV